MPKVTDYRSRIVLPITVDQYKIAQLYTVATLSLETAGNGAGMEVLRNEPFRDDITGQRGQYTWKKIHIGNRLPGWMGWVIPQKWLVLDEHSWNCYPQCRTVVTVCFSVCWRGGW